MRETSLMIEKPTIIVTSGGRTGTVFFYKLFKEILDDCVSFHEPENIDFKKISETLWKFRKFGLWNTTIKKIQGKWGITSISNRRMGKRLTVEEATHLLLKERKKFVESFSESIYVEASYHYYGLIDVLPNVFKYHRLIYIVRDGRNWVRSHMNKKEWYHEKNPHTRYKTRISPELINDNEYKSKWDSMSRFEKLCWAWATINKYAINTIKENPNAKLFYFENIFNSEHGFEELKRLVNFATNFLGYGRISYRSIEGKLEEKVNKPPTYDFPHWRYWSYDLRNKFNKICGPLMDELGYGNEIEWKKKT